MARSRPNLTFRPPRPSATTTVSSEIKERGSQYFQAGAVEILYAGPHEVHARVLGTRWYEVDLVSEGDGAAIGSCTCPYFDESRVCKHIWAVTLAARSGPTTQWRAQLRDVASGQPQEKNASPRSGREYVYVLDVPRTKQHGDLMLEVQHRDRKRDGSWGKLKSVRLTPQVIPELSEPSDRQILAMLLGSEDQTAGRYGYYYYSPVERSGLQPMPRALKDVILPMMFRTGRCFLRLEEDDDQLTSVSWDDGPPWEFRLAVSKEPGSAQLAMNGYLQRGKQRLTLESPAFLIAGGFVFGADGTAALLDDAGAFRLAASLRRGGPVYVPLPEAGEFLTELLELPFLPKLDLPDELRYEEIRPTPSPRIRLRTDAGFRGSSERLTGELSFTYENETVQWASSHRAVYSLEDRQLILRDKDAEAAAEGALLLLGFKPDTDSTFSLPPRQLPRVVRNLTEAGWRVEAEGKLYRNPSTSHIEVTSGIDWFSLNGSVEYDDTFAPLPGILAAIQRGESFVELDDGTFGLLPEQWLKSSQLLVGLGTADKDGQRFKPTQVALLDALLESQQGEVKLDEAFLAARDRISRFRQVEPGDAPASFQGELRDYQRDGLGWMSFLQEFDFGGCLADDMGLGKTVQVLALLESRRTLSVGPSLVIVPTSLVFNWMMEASRFTPELKILDHTGPKRLTPGAHFDDYDVVITTYGILKRDIVSLKDIDFDYCILDEAQAIKNPATASAKAAQLVGARHRLALSGTPIENHLGELWSLFEFLNPGMLGAASVFRRGTSGTRDPGAGADTAALLARALRPFILRRTKEQVAKELPPKTQQTLYCELGSSQRKEYDAIRNHYRSSLRERLDREGIMKSKMFVLEALLRLRQASCHLGLIDKSRVGESSAKLDLLLPSLLEVAEEGHKALVFSQFTSLLAIVRDRLDDKGLTYEYLDGRTRNRQAKVDRFQSDPDCPVFLISLKAGGLGLNLTAAEYVFLLDPWWNPAVEAQAIDRTHRIGQTRPVVAYRLIARDTVEEKVLELQESKKALADSIINAENSLIRTLSRADLELLLS